MKRTRIFAVLFLFFWRLQDCSAFENVLVITIDTLRADYVGYSHSNKVKTPSIDSLAGKGVVFKNTVSAAPFTLPSHVSLFTGMVPPVHGVLDNGSFYVDDKILTIAEVFKAQGFITAAFVGAFPVDSRFGLDQGFDVYDDSYPKIRNQPGVTWPERKAEAVADSALKWLQMNTKKRWFVWIHFFDPHFPYDPPDRFKRMYPKDPYAGEVAYTDEQVGRILTFLKTSGLESNTLVALTSDHGESLGEHNENTHGIFAYESTLRVPLVLSPLNPKTINTRVRLIDVAPTILALQNLSFPEKIQGTSLAPFLQTGNCPVEDSYFETLSMNLKAQWAPLRGFYSENYKFISLPIAELYDLGKDPTEAANLCGNAELCKKWEARFSVFSKPFQDLPASRAPMDSETAEQLRALGYVSGGSGSETKKEYGPKDDPKNLILYHNRVHLAMSYYNSGNASKALEMLDGIILERPDYSQAYLYASFILSARGSPDKSVELLRKAIQNGVSNAEVRGKLGLFLFEARKLPEAIEQLKLAHQEDPYNLDHLNYLGVAYTATGKQMEAEDTFKKALALDPSDGTTLSNLGALHLAQKKYDVAVNEFKAALVDNPHSVNTYHGLASVYAAQENWDEAIKTWNIALQKDGKNYEVMLQLAFAYLRKEDKDKALPLLREFEKNAPAAKFGKVLPKVRTMIEQLLEIKDQ